MIENQKPLQSAIYTTYARAAGASDITEATSIVLQAVVEVVDSFPPELDETGLAVYNLAVMQEIDNIIREKQNV